MFVFFLYPLKVDLSSSNLKVVFRNAQVHLGIANHGESFLGPHLMAAAIHAHVLKHELLLVHGGWGEQGSLNALPEPRRSDVRVVVGRAAHLFNGLDLMARALCLAIADGDIRLDDLAFFQHVCVGNLLIAQSHPAGVQAKRLRQEHQVLTVIADALIEVVGLLSCHDQITGHITELTVLCQRSLESLWLVSYQLDVKITPLVNFSNFWRNRQSLWSVYSR